MSSYQFEYTERGPYGLAVRLVRDTDLHDRVVLDLGCGAAAVAMPIRGLGATYVGVDVDKDAVAKLVDQGFEGHHVDLTADGLDRVLADILDSRPLAAVLCLDVLEHLAQPASVLDAIASVAVAHTGVELVVSVPNVAHLDLARRLLLGEWEMTDSGLLDRTHLRFFTDRSLTELMTSTGWYESARLDFELERSDQHQAGHPVFEPWATVGAFLKVVRSAVDDLGTVNQFVRRYHPGSPRRGDVDHPLRPLLSIVLRTQGQRQETLTDVLCCLAAQTCLDFEVVLVVHGSAAIPLVRQRVEEFEGNIAQRVRVISCDGGTRAHPANVGLREATGEYIAFLDDDDLITADWVENIRRGTKRCPGMVVRWWAAEQRRSWGTPGELAKHSASEPLAPTYANDFDFLQHIRQNETPFHCFAFPRYLLDLGLEFNEALTVCEDWELFLRAASLCGVYDTQTMTSIYNKWPEQSSAHEISAEEWSAMRSLVHVSLDERPLLLPRGSVRHVDRLLARSESDRRTIGMLSAEVAELRRTVADFRLVSDNAHHALSELRSSTSWKVSAPLRLLGTAGRRIAKWLRK